MLHACPLPYPHTKFTNLFIPATRRDVLRRPAQANEYQPQRHALFQTRPPPCSEGHNHNVTLPKPSIFSKVVDDARDKSEIGSADHALVSPRMHAVPGAANELWCYHGRHEDWQHSRSQIVDREYIARRQSGATHPLATPKHRTGSKIESDPYQLRSTKITWVSFQRQFPPSSKSHANQTTNKRHHTLTPSLRLHLTLLTILRFIAPRAFFTPGKNP